MLCYIHILQYYVIIYITICFIHSYYIVYIYIYMYIYCMLCISLWYCSFDIVHIRYIFPPCFLSIDCPSTLDTTPQDPYDRMANEFRMWLGQRTRSPRGEWASSDSRDGLDLKWFEDRLLGGELPTNRVGGWTKPGDFNGMFVGASRPQKYLGLELSPPT